MKRKLKGFLLTLIILIITGLVLISRAKVNTNKLSEVKVDSKSLIVKSENISEISNQYETISEEEKLYLLKYNSIDDAREAYNELKENKKVQKIVPNSTVKITAEDENEEIKEDIKIKETVEDIAIEEKDYVIALIDTGITEDIPNVIGEVSVLEDDDEFISDHGTNMAKTIIEEDEEAKILSIKALDGRGYGTVASIYKAINYAVDKKVDIINLSFSGYSNEDNELIKLAIDKATEKGILVVGSAGNKGENVGSFIPGNIDEVIVVAAANADGTKKESSNYGKTVDFLVEAENTSKATAKMTGKLSSYYANKNDVNGVIAKLMYEKEVFDNIEKYSEEDLKYSVKVSGVNADADGPYDLTLGTEKTVGGVTSVTWTYQKAEIWCTAKLVGYTIDGTTVKAKIEFRTYLKSIKIKNGATIQVKWAADEKWYVDNQYVRKQVYPRVGQMKKPGESVTTYDGSNDNFKYCNPTYVWYSADKGNLVQGPETFTVTSGRHNFKTSMVPFLDGAQGEDLDVDINVPYALTFEINMNGGTLLSNHGSRVSTSGNYITVDGSKSVAYMVNGGNLGTNGLPDYNNTGHINIGRTGYRIADSSKIYRATIGNETNYYDQTTNYGSSSFGGAASASKIIELFMNWTANTYKISYTLNGGTHGSSHPTSATYDTVVNISNPTKAGYTFAGWTMTEGNTSTAKYGESSSGVTTAWNPATTKVTFEYFKNLNPTHNATVTLVANWTPNVATITIKKDGNDWENSGINVALYQNGSPIHEYADGSKSGATVTWTAVTAGTYDIYASKSNGELTPLLDTGVNLVVNGSASDYINYYSLELSAGTGISGVTGAGIYLKGKTASINATVSTGYTWSGWTVLMGNTPASVTTASTTVVINQKTKLQANSSINTANVMIRVDGGGRADTGINVALYSGSTLKYSYANGIVLNELVTWSGVTAGTYNVYASKSTNQLTSLVNTGVTITIPTSGTVAIDYYTLDLEAGTNISGVTGGGIYLKNQSAAISATTAAGYQFASWTKITGNTPASTTNASTSVTLTQRTVLRANTVGNKSYLTVNPNGGTTGVVIGSNPTDVITATKTYEGYYEDNIEINKPTKSNNVSAVNYNVTFNYNGNGTANTTSQYNKSTIKSYVFSGWQKSNPFYGILSERSNGHIYKYGSTGGVTDTITANYTESTSVTENVVVLPNPTRTGYAFMGWYTAATGGTYVGYGDDTYVPTNSITLYAHWSNDSVVITKKKDDSTWTDTTIRVELYQNGESKYTYANATKNGATISWTGVVAGEYDIYASISESNKTTLMDTGRKVSVASNGAGNETVDYYTLTINKDTTISSTTGAGTYLSSYSAPISATASTGSTWGYWTVSLGDTPDNLLSASTNVTITQKTILFANVLSSNGNSILIIDPRGGTTTVTDGTTGGGGGVVSSTGPGILNLVGDPVSYTVNKPTAFHGAYRDKLTITPPNKPDLEKTYHYNAQYDGNGGQVGSLTDNNTTALGTAVTSYSFLNGWTKSSPFYGTLQQIMGTGTYTFGNTQNVVSLITAKYNANTEFSTSELIRLPYASRSGYTLNGWYTESTGGTKRGDAGGFYRPFGIVGAIMIGEASDRNETLYAQWTINSSTLTINPNGGSVSVTSPTGGTPETITESKSYTQEYASTLSLGAPTKTGTTVPISYTINYNGNGGTAARESDTSSRTDQISYPFNRWERSDPFYGTLSTNNVLYTFPPDAGVTSEITAIYGETITNGTQQAITLPTATRTGYTLDGWYTASSGGVKRGGAGDLYTPNENETLYAQWIENTATVHVRTNDAYLPIMMGLNNGVNVALYSGTTAKYTYANGDVDGASITWRSVEPGTYNVYASKDFSHLTTLVDTGIDITITATGEATIDYYMLSLDAGTGITSTSGGGTYLKNQTVSINATVMIGATWQNWTKITGNTPASTTNRSTTVKVTQQTTLKANATINTSTLTVNPNGGYVDVTSPTGGTTQTISTSTTFTQNANSTLTVSNPRKDTTTANTTLTIEYNGNNGTVGTTTAENTTSTRVDTTAYSFSSWTKTPTTLNGTLNGSVYTYPTANGKADTITANYTSTTTNGTATPVTLPTATRTGYVINGWYTAASGGTKKGNPGDIYTPTASETLYAHWTINTSTLTIDPNGGQVSVTSPTGGTQATITTTNSYTQEYNTTLTMNTPTKTNTSYTITYGVEYDGCGGTVATLTSANTNSSRTDTTSYTFSDWEQSETFYGTVSTDKKKYTFPAELGVTSTITANFTNTLSQGTQSQITLPNATKTGYALKGWYTEETGGTKIGNAGDTFTPTDDMYLYAQWEASTYTIGYTLNNGTYGASHPTSATYDQVVNISNPTRTGYTFAGWTMTNGNTATAKYGATATTVTNAWNPATTKVTDEYFINLRAASGTVTLVANWTANTYQMTYNGNGGTQLVNSNLVGKYDGYYNNGNAHSTTATSWPDISGNNKNGTITNGTWGSDHLVFDGTTWVNLGRMNSDYQTIEATFSIDSLQSVTQSIIGNWESGGGGIYVTANGRINGQFYVNSAWQSINSGIVMVPEKIYHVALTYDGATVCLYVNGELVGTKSASGVISPPGKSTVMGIGGNPSGTSCNPTLIGKVYNAAVYNTALTPAQIANDAGKVVTYGSSYGTLPDAARAGYTFTGWYTEPSGGTKITSSSTVSTAGDHMLYAQWTANTSTITIKKNNNNWTTDNNIQVALYQGGSSKYAYNVGTKSGATISWEAVTAGTYDIYASKDGNNLTTLVDTGIDVTVSSTGTATIDYYTLTLNKGIGISAVSGAGTYLKNQAANIDATVSSGYTWQGWSVVSGDSPQ